VNRKVIRIKVEESGKKPLERKPKVSQNPIVREINLKRKNEREQ
jgi:hypothetical protein